MYEITETTLHIKHDLKHLVQKTKVDVKSVETIWKENNIGHIRLLQIDCEGHDTIILKALYKMLIENEDLPRPDKIKFESNEWSSEDSIDNIFSNIGYTIHEIKDGDTILKYKDDYEIAPCFIKTDLIDKQYVSGIGVKLVESI